MLSYYSIVDEKNGWFMIQNYPWPTFFDLVAPQLFGRSSVFARTDGGKGVKEGREAPGVHIWSDGKWIGVTVKINDQ